MKEPNVIQPNTVPHLVIDLGTQALGDCIARIAVIPEVFKEAPHVRRVHVLAPRYLVDFARSCLKLYAIDVHAKEDRVPAYLDGAPMFTFNSADLTTLRMHLIDHAYMLLTQRVRKDNVYYPAPRPLGKTLAEFPYITACLDFTAQVRAFPIKELTAILDALKVQVILLGNDTNIPFTHQPALQHHKILDLRNRTTIEEAHVYIAESKLFFGVDNGLVHLAGCTSTPIVVGYTTVAAELRAPVRLNGKIVTLEPTSECRLCQSSTHFNYGHDYRNCAIVYPKCVTTLTAARWIEAIRSIDADLLV